MSVRIDGTPSWPLRVASAIFVALGSAHLLGTWIDTCAGPFFFGPVAVSLVPSIKGTIPRVATWVAAPTMDLWRLHLGCSGSLALGLLFLGTLGLTVKPTRAAAGLLLLVSIVWLAIAGLFYFWAPACAIFVATLLLLVAWMRSSSEMQQEAPRSRLWWWIVAPMWAMGTLHFLGTLVELATPFAFAPEVAGLRQKLTATGIQIAHHLGSDRSFWWAYLGFNLGHGWAICSFGLGVYFVSTRQPERLRRGVLPLIVALFSAAWLFTATRYWFYGPISATLLATTGHGILAVRTWRTTRS